MLLSRHPSVGYFPMQVASTNASRDINPYRRQRKVQACHPSGWLCRYYEPKYQRWSNAVYGVFQTGNYNVCNKSLPGWSECIKNPTNTCKSCYHEALDKIPSPAGFEFCFEGCSDQHIMVCTLMRHPVLGRWISGTIKISSAVNKKVTMANKTFLWHSG